MSIQIESVYIPSDEIVARNIEGEVLIVPVGSGIGDLEDELFSLNETGSEVWSRLDGKHTLAEIVVDLAQVYDTSSAEIEADVKGLVEELLKRKIIKEVG